MKGSSVRGTPYTHIDATKGLEGARVGPSPKSTVLPQFHDGGINTEHSGGTPYNTQQGNPATNGRVVQHGTNVESSDHGNQNDPKSNGPTVLLDVGPLAGGSAPHHEPTLDSPVPEHAARFDPGTIIQEDRAHLGSGLEHLTGDLIAGGGVMSRGLDSTSHPGEDEFELTRDDTLRKPEAGTQQDVSGHTGRRIRE